MFVGFIRPRLGSSRAVGWGCSAPHGFLLLGQRAIPAVFFLQQQQKYKRASSIRHVQISVLKGRCHNISSSVLLVKAWYMDKSKVKEQRNIFILSTGGIQKYLVIGSGKELKPLTQLTIRVIAFCHTLDKNRTFEQNELKESKEEVYKVIILAY